jgi:hypothetical protein
MYNNFINDCLNAEAMLEDIDDYIEYWHTHDLDCELEDFLGLTEYESLRWLHEGNDIFRGILYCRRHNIDYKEYEGMTSETRIAARSYKLSEIKQYKDDGK